LGDLKKSEEHLVEALKKFEMNQLNKEDFATTFNNLGYLYVNMGNLPKAEVFYLKSLKTRLDLFGEKHSLTATSYNNLGYLSDNMGNLQKAEEIYLKSSRLDLFGEKHSDTATSYTNLGREICRNQKSFISKILKPIWISSEKSILIPSLHAII